MMNWIGLSLGLAIGCWYGRANAQCDQYELDLYQGPNCGIFGFGAVQPYGLSDRGVVVGNYQICNGDERLYQWTNGSTITPLPQMSGFVYGRAVDINASGQIIGWHEHASGPWFGRRGFLLQNGRYTDLGVLSGTFIVEALAINSHSEVVGTADTLPFIWRQGSITQIVGLHLQPSATAYDINELSQVVGWMGVAPFPPFLGEAFLWQNGVGISLGLPKGALNSEALHINNRTEIVGRYTYMIDEKTFGRRSFFWRNGQFQDIGVIPEFEETYVTDLNDDGVVVAYSLVTLNGQPPPRLPGSFLWKDGTVTFTQDLLPPGHGLRDILAVAINNLGQIAGTARRDVSPFEPVGFLLTPRSKVLGDLDCNHIVDEADLLGVIERWGPSNGPADFNDDGLVNVRDLLTVIVNWTH